MSVSLPTEFPVDHFKVLYDSLVDALDGNLDKVPKRQLVESVWVVTGYILNTVFPEAQARANYPNLSVDEPFAVSDKTALAIIGALLDEGGEVSVAARRDDRAWKLLLEFLLPWLLGKLRDWLEGDE